MERPAVIFDMDGVLVDSYRAHYESWRVAASELGRDVSEEEFAATFGRTTREIIASTWTDAGLDEAGIAAVDARKEEAYREIIRRDFPAMPGACELLEALKADGFLLAIGSSGPPENVAVVIEQLPAERLFDAAITGNDVTRGKPDPQVFLLAAERLGVPPARCAVVEDAPQGVAAARAAGMASIGLVSTGRTRDELAAADLLVERLDELDPQRIRRLIARR